MGKSRGIALRRAEEVDTEEKCKKLINEYKLEWNCDGVRISEPDADGMVMIHEIDIVEILN